MDYEKKYKEALERARQIQNTPYTAHWDVMKEVVEYIFPEFKESEEERIRKALIHLVNSNKELSFGIDNYDGIKWSDILAWLEKQVHVDEEYNGEDYGIDGLYAAIDILQKTLGEVYGYQSDDGILTHKCAISAVKELSKQKSAWSEEDERYWSIIIAEFSKCAGKSVSKDEWMRCNDWLNSLRDRVQPKPEWSEEDETVLNNLIYALANDRIGNNRDEYVDWLKSLRPQNRWKPSDEQMEALWNVYQGGKEQAELATLYTDLKKLRNE